MTVQNAEDIRPLTFDTGLAGPVLTALAVSCASRVGFRFAQPQAAEWLRALAPVCGANVEPDADGWRFTPGYTRRGGSHRVSLPPGLSAAPVLAALAAASSSAKRPVSLRLEAVTHPSDAPSFHDFALGWNPTLEQAGLAVDAALEVSSFGADATGVLTARFFPSPRVGPFDCVQRGLLSEVRAISLVSSGNRLAASRLDRAVSARLRAAGINAQPEALPIPSRVRGAAMVIDARFERVKTSFTRVVVVDDYEGAAGACVDALQGFMSSRGALQASLAESLLVPAAVAASGLASHDSIGGNGPVSSRWTTTEVTLGLLASADVVRSLLDVDVRVQGLPGNDGLVQVHPRG